MIVAVAVAGALILGVFRFTKKSEFSGVPAQAIAYYKQGLDSLNNKSIEGAMNLFFKASDLDPTFAPALAKVAEAYIFAYQAHKAKNNRDMMKNMLQQAETFANKAMAADAKNGNANYVLGVIAYENDNKDEALRQLQISETKGYSSFDLHSMLGFIYNSHGEAAKCIDQYKKALDYKAQDEDTLYNLAELYFGIGNYSKAAEYYGEVVKVHGDSFSAKANYAAAIWKSGDAKRGKDIFNQILDASKGKEFRSYNDIAWVLIDKDVDYEWGLKLAHASDELKPKNIESSDILGWGYYKNKQYDKAVEYLNFSMKASPSDEIKRRLEMAKEELAKSRKQ